MNRMEFISNTETINTGGGCYVDCLTLSNNQVLCVNDECMSLYNTLDDFLEDDGTKSIFHFYLGRK